MKLSVCVIAITAALVVPAAAAATKSKKAAKPAAETAQTVDSNEASWRLVKGSLPIFLPSWSMPIYMKVEGDKAEDARKAGEGKKAKSAKKKSGS